MATECTQEAILAFLTERGGRVKNTDLTNHFKAIFPDDPEKKAMIREKFKSYVDNIAFVKSESGVKFVCLKKKFRGSVKENACVGNGTSRSVQGLDQERDTVAEHGSSSVTAQHLSGSEGNSTPKGSRKHFIEVMMNSSPQVRRSIVFRNSVYLSSRSQDSKSDSDSASLISCTLEDDRTSVALDPLEHEWMMCASDGQWDSLHRLLTTEPYLLLKKDFVTGFTCLHWAAKHGKSELLALIINFAKQQAVPIDVNVRSNTGYTPLHLAAMHNHMEVVKLLVGAYDADVEIRDYSGKKACQYLTNSVTADMRDIIGAYESCHSENAHARDRGRWRFSKVLPSNLKPLRLRNHNESNSVEGESHSKQTPLMRTSSFSRMKQKIRYRTSQIVHSRSFRDTEELESSLKGLFKSRPKSHFYG
uniref:Sosondowah ankyrin repeat domain family Cb n=1 Tax=Myripristis murdjan TaxID=586833 RepID=A0A667XBJ8_9TELE